MRLEVKTTDVLQRMNAPKVGEMLNITRQAVYQWGEYVPESAAFKLIKFFPDLPHKYVS